ncbi:hypothetical protein M3P36_14580 [Altererythrobacter sp. KTW20L]|uniref:hypothetical protein n=1 Tax=Altererythrobacter sp. KTW20L TaxID=2942210 RepID=UPI0020BD7F47|nr:hypothetical protein [Altererythrobacter sp. KTW20L]MCL6252265.1 hypothetical protein [Altererythrobacter sp. KTW20L]
MIHALLVDFRPYLQYLIIFALTAYAFARGAGPEKQAGTIMSSMVVLYLAYHLLIPEGGVYDEIDLGHLMIDLVVLVLLGRLAIRANRIYPLWMLAAQLISTLMHLGRGLDTEITPLAYFLLIHAPSYIQVAALALGLAAHRRRVRRFGTYRSWRTS